MRIQGISVVNQQNGKTTFGMRPVNANIEALKLVRKGEPAGYDNLVIGIETLLSEVINGLNIKNAGKSISLEDRIQYTDMLKIMQQAQTDIALNKEEQALINEAVIKDGSRMHSDRHKPLLREFLVSGLAQKESPNKV